MTGMRYLRAILQRSVLLAAGVYLVATVAMTWPLAPQAGSKIQDPGDPLFQIWVMRAVQHQLVTDPLSLYHANAFYPFKYSLAYSEEAISTAILAWPVYLVSGNDVLAYNVMFLLSFWVVAMGVYLLARELGAVQGAALIAGLLAAFAPARFGHLSHLHMLVIGWLPLALWALTLFVRGGQHRYLAFAGASLLILLLGSLHLAVFGTFALALYLVFLFIYERHGRVWTRRDLALLGAALLVPYLVFAPTLYPHMAAGAEYGFVRTRAEIERYSADPRAYLAVAPGNRFWSDRLQVRAEPFFPGLVAVAGVACALFWRRQRQRWPAAFALVLAGVAGLLSLGFEASVMGRAVPLPYAALYELVPPIRNIRGVGRFGLLTAIALPLLAAFGFSSIWSLIRERLGSRAVVAGVACTAVLIALLSVELWTSVGTADVPDRDTMAVYEWLADQPSGPVFELPANGILVPYTAPPQGLFQPIQYMYGSTRHWNPVIAGYSGYIPDGHLQLLSQFHDPTAGTQSSSVTEMSVGLLQDLGVRWVVIHRFEGFDWQGAERAANSLPQLRRVADVGISIVYELSPAGLVALPHTLGSLDVDGVAYSDSPAEIIVRLANPRQGLAVGELHRKPALHVTWTDSAGNVVLREDTELNFLAVIRPGETEIRVPVNVPGTTGAYSVSATVDGGRFEPVTRTVMVSETPRWSEPPLELISIVWNDADSLRHGDTLFVDVTWRVLAPPGVELSATVQLLDTSGARRANHDLLPLQIQPPSIEWEADQIVTLQFAIPIDPLLEPGSYDLLTALYFNRGDFPRVPIVLEDGRIATEMVVTGLTIVP